MNKIISEKFRIRNKKDWAIFWIFAVLICYALSSPIVSCGIKFAELCMANPYLTNLNDPFYGWNRVMVTLLLLAVVAEAVLLFGKKSRKKVALMAVVLIAAAAIPFLSAGGYRLHTNLIVSCLWEREPDSIRIYPSKRESNDKEISEIRKEDLSPEQQKELLELCRKLTVIAEKEEKEELEQWYRDTPDAFTDAARIYLRFEESYGHNYSFILRLYEGKVFLWRGYGEKQTVLLLFFEDNGITEWMEGIFKSPS